MLRFFAVRLDFTSRLTMLVSIRASVFYSIARWTSAMFSLSAFSSERFFALI